MHSRHTCARRAAREDIGALDQYAVSTPGSRGVANCDRAARTRRQERRGLVRVADPTLSGGHGQLDLAADWRAPLGRAFSAHFVLSDAPDKLPLTLTGAADGRDGVLGLAAAAVGQARRCRLRRCPWGQEFIHLIGAMRWPK